MPQKMSYGNCSIPCELLRVQRDCISKWPRGCSHRLSGPCECVLVSALVPSQERKRRSYIRGGVVCVPGLPRLRYELHLSVFLIAAHCLFRSTCNLHPAPCSLLAIIPSRRRSFNWPISSTMARSAARSLWILLSLAIGEEHILFRVSRFRKKLELLKLCWFGRPTAAVLYLVHCL